MLGNDTTEGIVWTPLMPDRRTGSRRDKARNVQPNGQQLKISSHANERRRGKDRRKSVTVTITGRAIDVEPNHS